MKTLNLKMTYQNPQKHTMLNRMTFHQFFAFLSLFFICSWSNPLLAGAPVNDECNHAIELDLYDSFATAKYLSGTTIDATRSEEFSRFSWNDDDVWYKFKTGSSGAPNGISIHTIFDDKVGAGYAFYNKCGGGFEDTFGTSSSGSCEDAFPINEALAPNTTYYIRTWSAFAGTDFQGTFQIAVYHNETKRRVFNDLCNTATTLNVSNGTCTNPVLWVTEGATDSRFDYHSAGHPNLNGDDIEGTYKGRDVWYKFRVPTSGKVDIQGLMADYLCPYNIVMNFYSGTCNNLQDIGWATYYGAFTHEFSGTAGQQIWMRTWLPYGRTNDYNLMLCLSTPCTDSNNSDDDGDRVSACTDDCPDDFFRSIIKDCDCGNAAIRLVKVSNTSGCKNNGTSVVFDDYYTADVTVQFDRIPTAGSRINIRGDFQRNITIPAGHNTITYTLKNQKFKPTGKTIKLSAYYATNSFCSFSTINAGMAPAPCSEEIVSTIISGTTTDCKDLFFSIEKVEQCYDRGTVYPQDDYFEADLMLHFQSIPASGHLTVDIGSRQMTIPVSSLSGNTHLLNDIRISASGEPVMVTLSFSEDPTCVATQQFEPLKVGENAICRQCNIMNVTVADIACTGDGLDLMLLVSGNKTGDTYTLSNGMDIYEGGYGQLSTFSLKAGATIDIADSENANCRYKFQLSEELCSSSGRYVNLEANDILTVDPFYSYAEGGVEMATFITNSSPINLLEGMRKSHHTLANTPKELTIFPNPASTNLTIEMEDLFESTHELQLTIFDVLGKVILSNKVATSTKQLQVDIQMIPEGVYLIELDNTQGKWTTQFVKG